MPATATRSSRLVKSKQSAEEKVVTNKKAKTALSPSKPPTPSLTNTRKSSGNKSPRANQESSEPSSPQTTRSKQNENEAGSKKEKIQPENSVEERKVKEIAKKSMESKVSTLDMSIKKDNDTKTSGDGKKSLNASTPVSTPRRSSRAPVPSSRFKDMEVALTPNSQKMKRSLSSSKDSDSTPEPFPKRSKKSKCEKSIETLPSDKECPVPSPEVEEKNVDNESHKQLTPKSSLQVISEKQPDALKEEKENKSVEIKNESDKGEVTQRLKFTTKKKTVDAVAEQSQSDDQEMSENVSEKFEDMEVTVKDQILELSSEENMKDIVNTVNAEVTFENEDKNRTDHQSTFLSPEISFSASGDTTEPTPQEVSVEEVGLSCQDGGIIVEETVHTYMDEKDVVIQNSDITANIDDAEEPSNVNNIQKEVELSLDKDTSAALSSSIMFKGQEVTVQERDGKMVAIVKIPANFGSHLKSPSQTETDQVLSTEKKLEESTSLLSSSSMKNIIINAPPPQKSRHGYILNKKTEKQPFMTLSDQDQNTFNISVEPTTMSSILKSKPESSTKSNPKSLYGRVIKQDNATTAKINSETSLVQNTPPSTSLIITKGNQKVSLLPQSIKATNPKECKPYSLLSSPSELLQKLKGDAEKKQTATQLIHEQPMKAQLSSPPKKVVIISHPTKSDDQREKSSSSLLNETSSPTESANVESSQSTMIDTTIALVNTETKPDDTPIQDEVQPEVSVPVIEEVASVSTKVEENLTSGLPQENDDMEHSELQQQKCQNSPTLTLSSVVNDELQNVDDVSEADKSKDKNLIIGPVESISQSAECGGDVTSDDLLISHEDKSTVEETVITSPVSTDLVVKQEVEPESEDSKVDDKTDELLTVDEKGKVDAKKAPKTQKIKLVDNGVVYELQIVSDGETRALQVQDETIELEGVNEEDGIVVKQEIVDDGNTSSDNIGKSTLGTQTIYTAKRGRPRVSSELDDTDSPVHKLATIVQEGGQKKHYYYVSVVPGKTMDGKYRRSVEHILPGCVVNDIGEYCCKECDYKTDKKANFYKHRRLHTGSKPHVCQVCKYQARTSSNLKRHMGIHEDIREFKCNQCSLSFRQKIHLERHIRYRHEEKRVKCPMCEYVCANEQPDLKMHIKRKHTLESGKVFICPQCNIEVGSKRDLKQHLKFHKDGPELKLFCKECSFVTDCKSRLQRHLVVHSNVKPYHCGVCDYKATQKEHVVRHLRSQHKIEVNKPKRPWKKQIKQESSEGLGGNSRGDFTCGDKIFACNHCTMRFAKLINLYKHLHTQHSDIMPAESESNYYCVVCEFSTSSKKNLLVHMRRHNMTDQTPPTHVYSCVLCRYVNPRRRNLFQHMRKKHNIDISTQVDIAGMTEEEEAAVRQDGDKMAEFIQTEPGVFTQATTDEMTAASSFESVDGNSQAIKDNLAGVANMIKIEDLTRIATVGDGKDAGTSVVIDNGDGTQLIQTTSLMQHKAADAIEGLQALAGQAGLIIDEEVSTIETKPSTLVIEQTEGGVLNAADATALTDGSSIILSADQSIVEEQVATIEETSSEQIQQIVESVESSDANSGLTSLELTEEQLSSLHHGDIVQMEGQVYMVELAQDPDSPDKQLLSFLPINQA